MRVRVITLQARHYVDNGRSCNEFFEIVSERIGTLIIAVIGEGNARPHIAELAEEVGRELARRNIDLVCGGMDGVMEAACRGAKSEGGRTIAILAGSDPQQANDYVDIPILTGLGYARNVIVVKTGMAVIAVGGAYGTLSEIGHALAEDIPVIGLETWALTRSGEPTGHRHHNRLRPHRRSREGRPRRRRPPPGIRAQPPQFRVIARLGSLCITITSRKTKILQSLIHLCL